MRGATAAFAPPQRIIPESLLVVEDTTRRTSGAPASDGVRCGATAAPRAAVVLSRAAIPTLTIQPAT